LDPWQYDRASTNGKNQCDERNTRSATAHCLNGCPNVAQRGSGNIADRLNNFRNIADKLNPYL
jgi:hypothetical protein